MTVSFLIFWHACINHVAWSGLTCDKRKSMSTDNPSFTRDANWPILNGFRRGDLANELYLDSSFFQKWLFNVSNRAFIEFSSWTFTVFFAARVFPFSTAYFASLHFVSGENSPYSPLFLVCFVEVQLTSRTSLIFTFARFPADLMELVIVNYQKNANLSCR